MAVAGRKLAAVAGDGRAFGDLGRAGPGKRGDDGEDVAQVASTDTAAALSEPSQSMTAGSASPGSGAESGADPGRDEAAADGADVHLHIDPTPLQVAVFLGVFLLGLATALVATSTGPNGAHRRH